MQPKSFLPFVRLTHVRIHQMSLGLRRQSAWQGAPCVSVAVCNSVRASLHFVLAKIQASQYHVSMAYSQGAMLDPCVVKHMSKSSDYVPVVILGAGDKSRLRLLGEESEHFLFHLCK